MKEKFQFSKIVVICIIALAIFGICLVAATTIFLELPEAIGIAIVAACGTVLTTTLVWFLKKSQVENNTKIYMSAYKEIAEFKYNHGEGDEAYEMLDGIEDRMIDKMDSNVNEAIDEGASLIEEVRIDG